MKEATKKSLIVAAAFLVVLGIATLLLLPQWPGSPSRDPELISMRNLGVISEALAHYQFKHDHRLPTGLAELIPEYISYEREDVLIPPWSDRAKLTSKSTDSDLRTAEAYVYLGERGLPIGVVVYEPLESLNEHGKGTDNKVAAILSDLSIKRLSVEDLKRKLDQLK
jgi:type II secretory pathway pseudopilin PulG